MDEENQVGGLSQMQPAAPALAQANVPAAGPQSVLSPVEVATKAYQDERKKLIDIQNQLLASLEARVGGGPQDIFRAMAEGFGAPTKTGSFGESLSYASKAMGDVIERGQKGQFDIAKLRAEMAAQQLGFKKEDIELAKTKQLSDTLVSALSGQGTPGQLASIGLNSQQASLVSRMPDEYKGMIIAQLQSGDVKGAVQELQKFMFEQTKVPDKVKELQFYTSQFKSPAARQAAEQLASMNYFMGDPATRAKTIVDIRRAIDAGEMPASEGNVLIQGMTSIGGMMGGSQPDSTTSNIVRQTMPTEDEALQRMKELNRLGVPASVSVAPSAGAAPAAGVSKAEVEPKPLSGAGVPTAAVIQGTPGMSPRQEREVAAAGAKVTAEERSKAVEAKRTALSDASDKAGRTINDANTVFDIVQKNPNAFGIFAKPGIVPAFLTAVENGIRVGNWSVGLNDLQDVIRKSGGTQQDIDAAAQLAYVAVQTSLELSANVKGSVSNYEQGLFQQATYTKNDSANVLKYKSELTRARAEFDKFVWKKYLQFEKDGKGNIETFKASPEYNSYINQYDSALKKIRNTYVR